LVAERLLCHHRLSRVCRGPAPERRYQSDRAEQRHTEDVAHLAYRVADRRAQQTFITDAGRERLHAAIPAVQAVEADLEKTFSARERDVVRTWLLWMAGAAASSEEEIPTA
jgi:hypothetical protein